MNTPTPIAKIPVAWLRPLPSGYKIPLWRWIILPATTWMLNRSGGIWMSGELRLMPTGLRFTQSKIVKSSKAPPVDWEISLQNISNVTVEKGMASENIVVDHSEGVVKFMAARSGDFVTLLNQAVSKAHP